MGGSDEVIVAVVALIVSVVALSATFMQVLQQYYASASGYSQCNDKVMGAWARTKSRRFSWEELRFEVQFDAPVIFVSPPDNKNGPILGAPIYFLDGTQRSMEETHTADEMDLRKEYHSRSVKERIHTADNERASWLSLLYAVQRMEAKSLEWQQKRYEQLGPPGNLCEKHGLPQKPPSLQESHTLTVALQRKRRSWDTMPSSVSKPYATTTMCHLIEMMAALGVYWKEFDRRRDRYRGEGNGFMVLGERISDLGLMFAFQVYGECRFEYNRVIPVDYIKELCFGYVPTIYRETFDQRRLGAPSDEVENLGSLQMASRREVAETLVVIGCNKNTVQYYLEEDSTTTRPLVSTGRSLTGDGIATGARAMASWSWERESATWASCSPFRCTASVASSTTASSLSTTSRSYALATCPPSTARRLTSGDSAPRAMKSRTWVPCRWPAGERLPRPSSSLDATRTPSSTIWKRIARRHTFSRVSNVFPPDIEYSIC